MAGADAVCGSVALGVGGTVTVSTSKVTADSVILLTHAAFTAGTPGIVAEDRAARVAGTSFKIVGDAGDGSTIAWVIFN